MRKHFIYIAAILLLSGVELVGCKKENEVIATASTGSISGKYGPAKAIAGAVAIKTSGNISTVAKLDSSNGFSITGLEAGNYKIGFSAMPGFIAPDTALVTVKAGENFDMGTVSFSRYDSTIYEMPGSISGKISPAGVVISISVMNAGGVERYNGYPDNAGNFKITGVTPGRYVISFSPSLQYNRPANVQVAITGGNNTDIGTIALKTVGRKAIDTIPGTILLNAIPDGFYARAQLDSSIVLTGHLYMDMENQAITPELASILNKIIVIKGALMISRVASASVAFNSLKELGQLYIFNATSLTSVDLSALNTVTSGILMYLCPALTNLKIGALKEFAGTLQLENTGFKDLSDFKSAMYKPFSLDIENNQQLTSLLGLDFTSDSVYDCTIKGNPLLTTLDGMQGIKRFKNETVLSDNPVLKTLIGLDNIIVAKQFTLTNNLQLNEICGAKQLINLLKDAPPYQKTYTNSSGEIVHVTKYPLVVSSNGSYATLADFVSAIGQCP